MKNILLNISLFCTIGLLITSCTRKDPIVTPVSTTDSGVVKLEFFNNVGASSLNMGNQWYKNDLGDSFKVTKFNYYISNVKLNGSNISYTEPSSYHLIQQIDPSSTSFNMAGVPAGQYTSITFTIGVDSLHNVSGAQTGALDPANGMFWSWNTGYIMLKLEGNSPKSTQANGEFFFHCGGFTGVNSVVRVVTLNLSQTITVTKSGINHIHLTSDVLQLVKSVDFSTLNVIHMPGPDAKMLADNYSTMFTITYAGL